MYDRIYRLIIIFVVLSTAGMLYKRFQEKFKTDEDEAKYKLIEKYLLHQNKTFKEKPILWIFNDYDINQRSWKSFGSRNSKNLNAPYIESCVESAIKHCHESFNIVLIDDNSFDKILPEWNIDISKITAPIKKHIRLLGVAKLLYYYGGMVMPNSTIVMKDLIPIYKSGLLDKDFFTVETTNRNVTSEQVDFFPSSDIMACVKNSKTMEQFVHFLENLNSIDYTNEMDFLGQANRWLYKGIMEKNIFLMNGKIFGTKDKFNKNILIEDLLGESYVHFDNDFYAIYIPHEEILKRSKYQWFSRLSKRQLYESNIIISKHLLVSHTS